MKGVFPLAALLLGCCLQLGAVKVHGEPLVIVAALDSPLQQISSDDVAALYLDQRSGINGLARVTPLDLKSRGERSRFYEQVTRRSLSQIRAYWSKRVFTGKGRPPRAMDPDDLARHLGEHPDAIGYLPQSRAKGLKTLLVISD